MAKKRKVGNLLAIAVLCYLTEKSMHPYELGQMLRERDDARSIKFNRGSLYMVVQQLARVGYITAVETIRDSERPERTVYALTDAGRAELRDWMRELVEVPQHEYPHFVAALSLIAVLPPGEVVELLGRRLQGLTEQRADIRALIDGALSQGLPPLFQVEEEYRLALLDAEIAFVAQFINRITDPDEGWGPMRARFHTGTGTSDER